MKFPSIRIEFPIDIDDNDKNFIEKYWHLKDGNFANSPTELKIKYEITEQEKNDTLSSGVYEIVTGECCDCKSPIKFAVRNQTEAKPKITNSYYHFFCNSCKEGLKEHIKYFNKVDKKKTCLYYSLQHKVWEKLKTEELDLLKTIIRLSKWEIIFKELLEADFYSVWPSIRKLSDIHLIDIYSNPLTGLTREIYFLPELAHALQIENEGDKPNQSDSDRISDTVHISEILNKKYLR